MLWTLIGLLLLAIGIVAITLREYLRIGEQDRPLVWVEIDHGRKHELLAAWHAAALADDFERFVRGHMPVSDWMNAVRRARPDIDAIPVTRDNLAALRAFAEESDLDWLSDALADVEPIRS